MKKTMKDEKNKTISWQNKRINEINKICSSRPGASDGFIEEVYDIYQSKADSYDEFVIEQKEKEAKYVSRYIKELRNLK
jgi:hypothetical protein